MTLHPAVGRNTYCGPAALSIITGLPTDEVARVMRTLTRRQRIRSVPLGLLQKTMKQLGLTYTTEADFTFHVVRKRPTLTQFVKERDWRFHEHDQTPRTYVIALTTHYCVVRISPDGTVIADNRTGYPVPFETCRRLRRRRVQRVWRIGA